MKKLIVIFSALLCIAFSNVYATQKMYSDLLIENARAKSTIPGVKVSAGYLKLTNNSDQTMRFIAAETPAAKYTEFHNMVMHSNKMVMRKVDEIQIKPKQSFEFKEKSYHFMFMGLNQRFIPGESISLTLIRDNGQTYEIDLPIIAIKPH